MLQATLTLPRIGIMKDIYVRPRFPKAAQNNEKPVSNMVIDKLKTEDGEHFYNYLKCQGLENEVDILTLSAKHHYYYDQSDLESVTTLVCLKRLNRINHLDRYLQSICFSLTPKTNFIGNFTDFKTQKNSGLTTRLYKVLINFLDDKTDVEIDKNYVSKLLESKGLKVIDMREIEGLTYFRSQVSRSNSN
jgi:hypothetical protein